MIANDQRKQTHLRLKKRAESPKSGYRCHNDAGSVAFQEVVSWGFIRLEVRRHHHHCLCWKRTPMSLISKRARVSAGGIYHHFESKEDLLQTLYRRIMQEMIRAIVAADDPSQPLAKRFQTLWLSIFRYGLAHRLGSTIRLKPMKR